MTYFISEDHIILFATIVVAVITFYKLSRHEITVEFTIDIKPYVTHIDYLKIGYEYIDGISTLLNSRSISQKCSVCKVTTGSISGTIKYNSGVRRKMNNLEITAIELFDSKYKNKNLSLSKFSWE